MANSADNSSKLNELNRRSPAPGRSLSPQLHTWLSNYCVAVIRAEEQPVQAILPRGLKPRLAYLEAEPEGDYIGQIDRLQNGTETAASRLTLVEISQNYRCNILLNRAGYAQTRQLPELFIRQARLTLAQLEQARLQPDGNWWVEERLYLPVYLNLGELPALTAQVPKGNNAPNLFQAVLQLVLGRMGSGSVPSGLLNEVVPQVLLENLEALDQGLAPVFLYRFNQWLGQVAPEARVVISCYYLNFPLYHPWFKAEQQWQFHAVLGFAWAEARQALAPKISSNELNQLEQAGLKGLFTEPALCEALYPQVWRLAGLNGLPGLLHLFLEVVCESQSEWAGQLARYSRLLNDALTKRLQLPAPGSQAPDALIKAVALGIIEKHPVAEWTRLVDPALDRLLAGWFCLQLAEQDLAEVLPQILAIANQLGPEWTQDFLKLLYLITPANRRPTLFIALLGQPPTPSGLELVCGIGQLDGAFAEEWRAFLNTLLNDPARQAYGRELLKLDENLAKLTDENGNPPGRTKLIMAEIALDLLSKQDQNRPELYLVRGQVKEQLGKYAEAQESYDKATQTTNLPALEGGLGLARLLTQQNNYEASLSELVKLGNRLKDFQAEIDNQLSVVKRYQQDYDAALYYARRANEVSKNPAYRHNLVLALYEKGDRERIERELEQLTGEYPNFAEGFYYLGRVQSERGESDKALISLRRAVELSATTASYLFELGRSLLGPGRYEEAYTYLKAAVTQETTQPDYLFTLGLVALKLNRLEEARTTFLQVLKLAGDNASADLPVYLAATEFAAENYVAASDYLGQALKLQPGNPLLHLLAGRVAEASNQSDAALSHYRQAVALGEKQTSAPLQVRVAWQLALVRRLRLSVQGNISASAGAGPGNPAPTNGLQGRGEVSAPALQEAQRYCNEAAKLQPNLPEALYEAGQLALARKAYPEAAKLFEAGVAGLGSRKRGLTWTPSLPGSEATLDAGWLALFSNNDNLAFELRYAQAEALREVGQTAQAQKVWLGLLKTLDEQAEEAGEKTAALRATQKAAVNYQLGLSLLATQNYQESLPYLGEAVSHEPKNAAYHLGLAKALQAVGNPERALYELNQARELDPAQVEVYAELAELQLATKAKALDTTVLLSSLNLYSKALEIQPANTAYLYRAALLAYHLHYQNQATELIKRLLDELKVQSSKFNTSTGAGAQSPVSVAEAHLLAACNFERGGELNRARTEISLALTHPDPTKPDYFVVAARLARKANMLGNMEQALEALKEREKLPLSLQAAIRAEEGWLALARNRYQEAANFYQQAIALYQQSQRNGMAVKLDELYHEDGGFGLSSTYDQALLATYKFAYARALRQLHQYEPACRELDEAIKLNPRFAEAHVLRGEMLVEQGKFLAALESLKIAAELEPNPARFYELGKTYLKVEKPTLAAEALKQAGSREIAGKSEYYNYLGLAYEKSGNNSAARAAYSCGLQIDPNSPDLHQALARCYLNEGERLAAVQPLQGAVVSEPANPVYRLALAQLYEELGWWQEAASEYEQAATLNPTDPQAWLKTGQLLVRTGRTEQGRAALEQALRLNENLAEAHYELGKLYLDSYSAGQDEQAKLPPDLSGMYGPANEEMPAVSKPLEVIKG